MHYSYKKGTAAFSIKEGLMAKMCLFDGDDEQTPIREHIFVKRDPRGEDPQVVLINHAVNLQPWPSWGALLDKYKNEYDLAALLETGCITLHPQAWETYLSQGIIDEQGVFLDPGGQVQQFKDRLDGTL